MPFNQSGPNASATFGTYNDIAGDQTNNSKNVTTGNIKGTLDFEAEKRQLISLCVAGDGGSGGSGVGKGYGVIAGGMGTGGAGGAGGTVNISCRYILPLSSCLSILIFTLGIDEGSY